MASEGRLEALIAERLGVRGRVDKVERVRAEEKVFESASRGTWSLHLQPIEANGNWWLAAWSYETETLYISEDPLPPPPS